MMQALFSQGGATLNVELLADKPAQDFIEAHAAVLDSSFHAVPMSEAMRRRLTRSDYIFSGIKAFHELNEAFPSLLDENGNRKPFERFLNDVRKIDATYNEQYLHAEYNFVHASADMAAKWEDFQRDGDRYDLQYRTAGDDHVRPAHAALHGVTLPPSDSFWAEYYPPNGWNCFVEGTPVLTSRGWTPIEKIKKGDLVFGGSGNLRKVTATLARDVQANLVRIVTKGATATCTENHRFLTRRGWVAASGLHAGDILVQVGENAPLHILVNAIRNAAAVCRQALVAHVAEREAVAPLAVNHQAQARNIEVGHVARSYQHINLEWQGACRQIAGHDFFHFAQWLAQCAHAIGMGAARGDAAGHCGGADFRAEERAGHAQTLRDGAHKHAVRLRLALADVLALLRQAVVHLRKGLARLRAACGVPDPLRRHGLAAMTHGDAATVEDAPHGAPVHAPMGGQPSEAAALLDVSPMRGLTDIHAFHGFHSLLGFFRNTFLHCRYVIVEDKVTTKSRKTTVFNLAIDTDESYIVPVGIAHNCRCTVVQVRRGKYPQTPHDEAMSLGEDALGDDKKGFFRFNSGQRQQTFPDYNPYTIRRCNDCDIAKGKTTLAFVPENQLCQACRLLRQCHDQRSTKKFKDYRSDIVANAVNIQTNSSALKTGVLYQTKSSLKRGIAHARNIEELDMFTVINNHVEELIFTRLSELGEVKDMTDPKDIANIKKKIKRGVTGYNIYELQLGSDTWIVKTEIHRNKSEAFYTIYKKR